MQLNARNRVKVYIEKKEMDTINLLSILILIIIL